MLVKGAYYTASAEPQAGRPTLVCLIRSERPFGSMKELDEASLEVISAFAKLDLPGYVLLVDLRRAPGRNDPTFETAMNVYRPRFLRGFRRVAIWVQTAVGTLQLTRHSRQDQIDFLVSTDEAKIFAYLNQD